MELREKMQRSVNANAGRISAGGGRIFDPFSRRGGKIAADCSLST